VTNVHALFVTEWCGEPKIFLSAMRKTLEFEHNSSKHTITKMMTDLAKCLFAIFIGYMAMAAGIAVTVAKITPKELRDQIDAEQQESNTGDKADAKLKDKKKKRLQAKKLKPLPNSYLAANMLCSAVFAAVGSFVSSLFDPYQARNFVSIVPSSFYLALLILVMGFGYYLDYKHQSKRRNQVEPHWYRIYLLVVGPLAIWLGSLVYTLMYL